ncbi:MAG: HDIG domain-containing protein [Clostridia bacterium]|nr:HDIG domain-containing protein [Clostridia bacterium]
MMKSFFSNALHATITIVSFVLIVFVVLFSNRTGQIEVNIGDVSTVDIYAPRAIVDQTTTTASRNAARKSVENVYVRNDDKRISAVENVTKVFAHATTLRGDENINVSAGSAQLQAAVKLDISQQTALALMSASDKEFSALRKVSDIVDNIMSEGISDVSSAREKCSADVSSLKITASQKEAANEIISLVLTENLELDEAETERRREAAAASVPEIEYKKNQIIVRKGEIISEAQLNMLSSLGILKGTNPLSPTYTVGIAALMLICYIVFMFHLSKSRQKNSPALPIASVMGLLMVVMSFYGSEYVPEKMISLLPAGIFPCIVSIFAPVQTAITANLIISVFCGVAFDANWGYTLCLILAGTASSYCFSYVKRRTHLLPATFISSLFYGFVFCSMSLIESSGISAALGAFAKGFLGGFLSGLITIGSLPLFEWLFNATTPMKLSELANPENKLLKKLLIEAPGTYHHSLTVANISEIAARSVNANPLLARVGAYYHDIGKLRHPLYFKENQYDKNAHEALSPSESAALIIGHVTDGVEIAVKNRLPKSICDIISQHHGTTTAGYFLLREKEQNPEADEALFTYKGPVPQTKEAAIVMLADACEAAVRSIDDKSEGKIEAMVRRLATERVNSGQFSECNLTFRELETVIKVITKTLGGYFHERIKYE